MVKKKKQTGEPEAAVLLVQWLNPTDRRYDIELFEELLEEEFFSGDKKKLGATLPLTDTLQVDDSDSGHFLRCLAQALRAHPEIQIIYFSTHGTRNGLRWGRTTQTASFQQISKIIRENVRDPELLTLVFGACNDDAGKQCCIAFVGSAQELTGFDGGPTCNDAARLLAGVLAGEMDLWQSLHQLNVKRCEEVNQNNANTWSTGRDFIRNVQEQMSNFAETFDRRLARYLRSGRKPFHYKWDFERREWRRSL